jgi:hypothetical protein
MNICIYVYIYYNMCLLIISYCIHISEFKLKKSSISYIQIIHIFIKVYHVLKHNGYVKFFKIQK